MNGIEMMLKMAGVDPAEIMAMLKGVSELAQSIDTRLSAIEKDIAEMKAANSSQPKTETITNG